MSKLYIDVKKMLADYGTDITVYKPSSGGYKYIGGIRIPVDDDSEAEPRHEPVIPTSSRTSMLGTILAGGTQVTADLVWLSSGKYPVGTVVDVPTQGGKYRVVSFSNYTDYSNLIEYGLKGDDKHPDGY